MDNQQERLEVVKELSWFGGIIDGEGTITIRYKGRKNQPPLLTPTLTVPNTDKVMIDEIVRILKKHEIAHWISYSNGTKKHKPSWKVEVTGIKRVAKALPIIEEYLVNKKDECRLVREWCNYRVNEYGKYRNHLNYSKYDYDTVIKIKSMHGHQDQIDLRKLEKLLKSSETTC